MTGKLPKLGAEHRRLATRLIRGGDVCLYEFEAGILNDLRAHGFRWIAPCGIAYIHDADITESAQVYQRLFGNLNGNVGDEASHRRWLAGLSTTAAKVSTWLSGTG